MNSSSDTSLFGGKELDAVGEPVWAITLDSNVVILMGQHREHEFRIENDITVENHGNGSSFSVRYDPYNRDDPIRENLTELAAIITKTVVHAVYGIFADSIFLADVQKTVRHVILYKSSFWNQ